MSSLQMKTERNKCSLCRNACDIIFEYITEATKEALNELQLNIDLSKTDDPIMCGKCSETIQKWLELKSSYLQARSCLDENQCLIDVYPTKTENNKIPESHTVCLLCMKIANSANHFVSLTAEEKDVTLVKIMLLKYFIEIDINHAKDPVICVSCFENLQTCSTFITIWFEGQEKIRKYYEDNGIDRKEHIELCHVLENKTKCLLNAIKVEEKLEEMHSTTVKSASKNIDATLRIDDGKIEIKQDRVLEQNPNDDEISVPPYKCKTCNYHTNKPSHLKKHTISHKSMDEVTIYKCEIYRCTFKSKYKDSLNKHLLVHKSTNEVTMNKCPLCEYQTRYKYYLTKHLLVHKKSRSMCDVVMYRCTECNYETPYRENLPRHMARHKSTAMMKCHLCDYQTKLKSYLHKHMNIHKSSEEPPLHKCTECSFEAENKSYMQQHMLLIHKTASQVSSHRCHLCDYQTRVKGRLTAHMLTHKTSSEVVMYRCTNCGFGSKHKNNLTRHMLIHKEEALIKCHLCDYRTNVKRYLRQHMVVHESGSDAVVHKCTECDFETKRKRSLASHMWRHKGTNEVNVHNIKRHKSNDEVMQCAFVDKYKTC